MWSQHWTSHCGETLCSSHADSQTEFAPELRRWSFWKVFFENLDTVFVHCIRTTNFRLKLARPRGISTVAFSHWNSVGKQRAFSTVRWCSVSERSIAGNKFERNLFEWLISAISEPLFGFCTQHLAMHSVYYCAPCTVYTLHNVHCCRVCSEAAWPGKVCAVFT